MTAQSSWRASRNAWAKLRVRKHRILVLAFSILSIYHNWCQNIKFILILINKIIALLFNSLSLSLLSESENTRQCSILHAVSSCLISSQSSLLLFKNKFSLIHSQSPTTVTICLAILYTMSGKLPSLHIVTLSPSLVREVSSIPWWASRDDRRKSPRHPFSAIVSSIWVPLMQNGKLSEILLSWIIFTAIKISQHFHSYISVTRALLKYGWLASDCLGSD